MVDVGFDSDKHAQTRDDMKRGGQSLGDSSEALGPVSYTHLIDVSLGNHDVDGREHE